MLKKCALSEQMHLSSRVLSWPFVQLNLKRMLGLGVLCLFYCKETRAQSDTSGGALVEEPAARSCPSQPTAELE